MARWNVLVTAPRLLEAIDRFIDRLESAGCEVRLHPSPERLEEPDLLPIVGDLDGVICGDDRFTKTVLEAAPRLRVISKWGTGIDSIDVEAAKSRGVVVCNVPRAFNDPVADTAVGYILLFARNLEHMAADMRSGIWRRRPSRSLRESTVGIVGLGAIGLAVAGRVAAFGARVLGHDVRQDTDSLNAAGVTLVSLDTLLEESDFVTLHATLHAGSYHLIDAARLRRMKPGAILINTARGSLVDEVALVDALETNRIGGAALDVFENEPLPLNSRLRVLSNVYTAPHNANASAEAAERVHDLAIRNLLGVLDTKSIS